MLPTGIWQEFKHLIKLASPILVAQLSLAGLGVADTIMSGQVGINDLAAIGIGSSIFFPVIMLAVGLLSIITTLVSKEFGKNNNKQMVVFFQQGIWLSIPIGMMMLFLLVNSHWLLDILPLEPEVYKLTQSYLFYIALGLPALAIYFVFRFFWEGIGLTIPTMWISLLTLVVNIPLNFVFIYGWGPIDAYGAAGCGIASAITMWAMLLVAIGYAVFSDKIKPYLNFNLKNIRRPLWKNGIEKILSLGVPNTLALLFEVSLFSFIGLFIVILGTEVIAAQQIAVSYTSLLFMLPLSISMAITIRASYAYGKGLKKELYIRIYAGLFTALMAGIFSAFFTYMLREPIAGLYTDNINVLNIAVGLLTIAAIYQTFDAMQVASAGALRGLHNTKITMWVTFFCYWGIGLGIGYLMAFTSIFIEPLGVKGFWYAIVIGFVSAAAILLFKLFTLLRKIEAKGEIY